MQPIREKTIIEIIKDMEELLQDLKKQLQITDVTPMNAVCSVCGKTPVMTGFSVGHVQFNFCNQHNYEDLK